MRLSVLARFRDALHRVVEADADIAYRNREGLADYDFVLPGRRTTLGVSAMVRAKNEESKILTSLASILNVFDEIVVIDNGSTDRSLDLIRRFKRDHDSDDRLVIFEYPHEVAPCGQRHWETPEDSLHSLVYFYNWCRSKCRHAYVCKWDADMVLAHGAVPAFRAFLESLGERPEGLWSFPIQTLYRSQLGIWHLSIGELNQETMIVPNRSALRYHKAQHWEALQSEVDLPRETFELALVYELKDVAEDEFDHWSTRDFPTSRKQREWRNFNLVRSGDLRPDLFTPLHGRIFNGVT